MHQNKRSIITQREVPDRFRLLSRRALKAALREDADIVLVGEMRDLETISLALTAAETGLLVFGTLHTNNARKTVDRMIDVFPADQQAQVRTMLANSLRGVVAQLLLQERGRLRPTRGERDPDRRAPPSPPSSAKAPRRNCRTSSWREKGRACSSWTTPSGHCCSKGMVSPHEAYMKAIDKNRFKKFLSAGEAGLANAAGSAPDDQQRPPGDFVKAKRRS